ncbi:unnamed protein product, partial [Rotaria sp. Silwood2]
YVFYSTIRRPGKIYCMLSDGTNSNIIVPNKLDCSSMDDEQYCVRTVPSYWKSRSMQVVNQLVYQMLNKYFNKKFYLDNCLVNCADESDESLRDG